jgi:hypothetical protein
VDLEDLLSALDLIVCFFLFVGRSNIIVAFYSRV